MKKPLLLIYCGGDELLPAAARLLAVQAVVNLFVCDCSVMVH